MIKDVGEDPLCPALRDIEGEREREGEGGRERERERERGQNCTRHTVVTPSLCGLLVKRRSAEGQKFPLRLSSRNECYPSPIFKPSLGRREIYPLYLSPLGGIGKRNIIFIKAHVQEIRIQNSRIKIKISKSFFFLLKIYSALQN